MCRFRADRRIASHPVATAQGVPYLTIMEQSAPLTVIYNDSCPICAREIAAYRRFTQRHGLDVSYLGISSDDLAGYGLTKRAAARRLHVIENGTMTDGIPAFALLWDRIPKLRWLARAVRLPVLSRLAALIYDHALAPALFALHRRRERLGKAVPRG